MTDPTQNPRDVLRSLLEQHGPFLADEPDRCRSLLEARLQGHGREINVLIAAAQTGVPAGLRASADPLTAGKLALRLTELHGTREDLARWAVDTWAAALGLTLHPAAPLAPAPPRTPTARAALPESLANDPHAISLLVAAITAGDLDKVRAFIEEGISVRHRDRVGQLPLFVAARDGRADVVRLLIAQGLDVNGVVENGRNALYYAASEGHVDVVRALMDLRATVDALDSVGRSALVACMDCLETKRLNAPDRTRWASEESRSPSSHTLIAEMLILAGANVNLVTPYSGTPAQIIRETGVTRLMDLLKGREKRSFLSGLFGG